MSDKKNPSEMSTEELRARLLEDSNKVITLLQKVVHEGLESAPDALLRKGDAFIILTGALQALEYRWLQMNGQITEEEIDEKLGMAREQSEADKKKFYN